MPKGLVRYQQCGCFHFLTFSCYRRQALLTRDGAYGVFERELETVRARSGSVVAGYVLMPEHVHLLVGEPSRSSLPVALQVLKQQTSRKLKLRERFSSGNGGITISTCIAKRIGPRPICQNSGICIGIRSSADWSRSLKTGLGRAFGITQ